MADHDPGLGHDLVQPEGEGADGLDPVVDEEDLAAALDLVEDGLAHHLFGELADAGLHRLPVSRWGLDERDVAQTAHGHVEGARDRRRGHGDHIDFGAQLFELLLLGDAETLLLVEDDQAEIAETDIGAQESVGADHDVDSTLSEFLEGLLGLTGRDEPGEHTDLDRETGKPPLKGLEVLADEDRCRSENRHLFALEDRFEGGADGDLGLAVADIAAEQAVHRAVRLHVGLDLRDRPFLVVGEIVLEGVLELALPRGVGRELESARAPSNGRQSEQSRGHLADRLFDPRLAFGPGRSSEPVELGAGLTVPRGVLLDEIGAFDGNQEIVASPVGEDQHLELAVLHHHPAEPVEPPDAVIEVDHRVAGPEVAEIGDEGRCAAAAAPRWRRCGEIASAVDREPVAHDKAVLDAALDDGDLARRRWRPRPVPRPLLSGDARNVAPRPSRRPPGSESDPGPGGCAGWGRDRGCAGRKSSMGLAAIRHHLVSPSATSSCSRRRSAISSRRGDLAPRRGGSDRVAAGRR